MWLAKVRITSIRLWDWDFEENSNGCDENCPPMEIKLERKEEEDKNNKVIEELNIQVI